MDWFRDLKLEFRAKKSGLSTRLAVSSSASVSVANTSAVSLPASVSAADKLAVPSSANIPVANTSAVSLQANISVVDTPVAPLPASISVEDTSAVSSLPERLWNDAYDGLRVSEPNVTDAFEKILSYELCRSEPESATTDLTDLASQKNNIEHTPEERWRQMEILVQAGLQKTAKEAAVKQNISDGMQVVQSIQDLVGNAVESCPQAALAWAGVSLVIQVLSNPFSEAAANRQGISYVLSRMEWYWNLSSLLLDENRAQKASAGLRAQLEKNVVDLYQKLLLFEMRSACLYHRKPAVVFLRDLVQLDHWDSSLTEIRAAEDAVRKDSEQYSTQEIRTTLQGLWTTATAQEKKLEDICAAIVRQTDRHEQAAQDAKANECLADLHVTNPEHDKARIEDVKGGLFAGSYRWILDDETFCRWRKNADCRLLWVKGGPGKGKTMLLCGIIDELRLKPTWTGPVSFFFCEATDTRINSATAVLRGLISHLVRQRPQLLAYVRPEYDKAGKKVFEDQNAWVALSKMFLDILKDPAMENACIMVDALDECTADLSVLLALISRCTRLAPVKWVLSSRMWQSIEEALNCSKIPNMLCLQLDEVPMSKAVEAYVCHKVGQLADRKDYSSDTRDKVQKYLVSQANDTFLWVALVCQKLADPDLRKRHTLKVLNSFPPGLNPLYKRMLDHIDSYDADLCLQVLALAALAYRPLTTAELIALVEPQDGELDSEDIDLKEIIGSCGSFLALRDDVVSFIHQSAREFLLNQAADQIFPSGIASEHAKTFSSSLKVMHRVLKRDIYGLNAPGFPIDSVSPPCPDPLGSVRYSCIYWANHLCDSLSKTDSQNSNLQDGGAVDTFLRVKYLHWIEALSLLRVMSEGIIAIRKLEGLGHKMGAKVARLVRDARRHIVYHRWIIENAPLQVYASALVFSPTQSEVRKLFAREEPTWITRKPAVGADWSACLQTLGGHTDRVRSVVFSPDDKLIASGSFDCTVKVWDTALAGCLQTFRGHTKEVNSVAFSPTGRQIVSGSDDCDVRLWDLTSGQCMKVLRHERKVSSVAISPNGSLLASSGNDKNIWIWNLALGVCVTVLEDRCNRIPSVTFSPNGLQLASASFDGTVRLWDVASGSCTHVLNDLGRHVFAVAFSPDGKQFASALGDEDVRIWDAASATCVHMLPHSYSAFSVSFSPHGLLALATTGTNVQIWETSSRRMTQLLRGHSRDVDSVAFSSTGNMLVSASADHTIKIWDMSMASLVKKVDYDEDVLESTILSPDGKHCLSTPRYSRSMAKLWVSASGKCAYTFENFDNSLANFSPNSQQLALVLGYYAHIWDLALGKIVHRFGDDRGGKPEAFSPDGRHLAIRTDQYVKVYDPVLGTCRRTLQEKSRKFMALSFSQDGEKLAMILDEKLKVWNTSTGDCILTLDVSYEAAQISPDGTLLACSTQKKREIWNMMSGESIRTFAENYRYYPRLRFSPDSKRLIAAKHESSIASGDTVPAKLWDAASDRCISFLIPPSEIVSWKDGCLLTDLGYYALPAEPFASGPEVSAALPLKAVGYGFSKDRSWITHDSRNVLWLPPEYRPKASTVQGHTLGIGYRSGRVFIISFSTDT